MEEKVNQLGFTFIKALTIMIINFHYRWPPKSYLCYGILPFYTGKLAKTQNFPAANKDKGSHVNSTCLPTLSPAPTPPCPGPCHAGPRPQTRPCRSGPWPPQHAPTPLVPAPEHAPTPLVSSPQARVPRPLWRLNSSHVRFPYIEIANWLLANTLLIS